ncbi:MAG: dNTP triphosphohydrolase [Candidatus Peregrinibacteria bacterium]
MFSLQERLKQANTLLAPYAVPHEGIQGRAVQEPDDETRFPFQRDRDRIIHTQAFRRLKGKTQVFVAGLRQGYGRHAGGGDHVRTRLTHTLEVAQISRDIARTLSLNEDLAECIALAHDLGHPPFGHAGEEALDAWMQTQESRFEHNEQSLRIVTVLEEHSSLFAGLNLNREILEGLKKHFTPHDEPATLATGHIPSLEGQLVNLADEIAYTAHDCDDGLNAELFTLEEITAIPLANIAAKRAAARGTSLRGALIHLLVTDLYAATEKELSAHDIRSLKKVAAAPDPLACFSPAMERDLSSLHDFLWQHLYLHPRVQACNTYGQSVVTTLCQYYEKHPSEKILALAKKTAGTLPEAIKDYVSGMTDAFAIRQAQELKLTAALGAPPAAPGEP